MIFNENAIAFHKSILVLRIIFETNDSYDNTHRFPILS